MTPCQGHPKKQIHRYLKDSTNIIACINKNMSQVFFMLTKINNSHIIFKSHKSHTSRSSLTSIQKFKFNQMPFRISWILLCNRLKFNHLFWNYNLNLSSHRYMYENKVQTQTLKISFRNPELCFKSHKCLWEISTISSKFKNSYDILHVS